MMFRFTFARPATFRPSPASTSIEAVWRWCGDQRLCRWRVVWLQARLVVVLEAVANADNVGGVFRNAAAFGADAVLLGPIVLRSTVPEGDPHLDGGDAAGAVCALGGLAARARGARGRGFTIVGLTPRASAAIARPLRRLEACPCRPARRQRGSRPQP